MIKLIFMFYQTLSGRKVYPPLSWGSLNIKLNGFGILLLNHSGLIEMTNEEVSCYMSGKRFPSKLIQPGCHRVIFSGNKPKEEKMDACL